MIQHQGVWLPNGERHLVQWMDAAGEIVDGRGTYQIKKLRAALAQCRGFRGAIDVGAHVGFWSMQLAKRFEHVYAFEPVTAHRECFVRNVESENVFLFDVALGNENKRVSIETLPTSSGDSRVVDGSDTTMRRLDDFRWYEPDWTERRIDGIDFIKIDCEGYELNVLKGAEALVLREKPVIIVEQKKNRGQRFGFRETEAVEWLVERGYRVVKEMSGDYIMVPQQ